MAISIDTLILSTNARNDAASALSAECDRIHILNAADELLLNADLTDAAPSNGSIALTAASASGETSPTDRTPAKYLIIKADTTTYLSGNVAVTGGQTIAASTAYDIGTVTVTVPAT